MYKMLINEFRNPEGDLMNNVSLYNMADNGPHRSGAVSRKFRHDEEEIIRWQLRLIASLKDKYTEFGFELIQVSRAGQDGYEKYARTANQLEAELREDLARLVSASM